MMKKISFLITILFLVHAANAILKINGYTRTIMDRWQEFENQTNVSYQLGLNFHLNIKNKFRSYFNLMNENFYTTNFYGTDYTYPEEHSTYLSNANIVFRQEFDASRGIEGKLFYRGSDSYWLDGSMLNLLDVDKVKDDDNGRGARFDFWYSDKMNFKYVFSDFSGYSGNDLHLLRLRTDLFQKHFVWGGFFFREIENNQFQNNHRDLIATDLKFYFPPYALSFEAAKYDDENSESYESDQEAWKKGLKEIIKANTAFKAQLEGIGFGNYRWGHIHLLPGVWSHGDTYNSHFDNDDVNNNEIGYWINAKYLVPKRAITLTFDWSEYKYHVAEQLLDKKFNEPKNKLYSEVYIEFVNGFKYKFYYERRKDFLNNKIYSEDGQFLGFDKKGHIWNDVLNELSVENFVGRIRTQYFIKDLGESTQKNQFGVELSVNLTDKTRFFYRGLFSDENQELRKIFFAEISYRVTGNSTIYFQYGPYGIGDNNLVFDDDFNYFNYTNIIESYDFTGINEDEQFTYEAQSYIQKYFRIYWEVGF